MNHTYRKYQLKETRHIDELRGEGSLYEHIGTGAKVFTLKNDDRNKVFAIGFRTTPPDSTGVAHIMEHSVLCGSAKYPLKDPFVELAKGSLNTFLNAITFPDKTLYPVASVNDRDFMNLMDVYLDSVFHPKVYTEPKIFLQEGWHYELSGEDSGEEELKINGVVYNEMKGAFSNPDAVLERFTMNTLFKDTVYSNESGGLPSDIPDLSYEEFLDFHRTYYHPSNSYIYLYGDMDMEEKLAWIDENYLCDYDRIEVDSQIGLQPAFTGPVTERKYYAIGSGEDEAGKCYLSANYVIEDEPTQVSTMAWHMLESVLLGSPGAILREALIKAGIGEDVYGGLCAEIAQPFFSIVAKNTDENRQEEFRQIIRDTLEKLVSEGINKKSLRAELNYLEFKFREEDYGYLPAGLAVGIAMFGSWLYDRSPFTFLFYNDAIEELRALIETDYFEQKIRKHLLDNDFMAYVNIIPSSGMTERENEELAERLRRQKDAMSAEEKERIALETMTLKAYQAEPDEPEVIAKLPVLKISDIGREAEKVAYRRVGNRIYTEADNRGIAYIKAMFDTTGLYEEELQFAALLCDIMGEMDTAAHSYSDLYDEILLRTGGVDLLPEAFAERNEDGSDAGFKGMVTADIRTLESRIGDGFELAAEIICDTLFDDTDRLTELLFELRSRLQTRLDSASHTAAAARASSYISKGGRFGDLTNGIAYFDFICEACRLSAEPVQMKCLVKSLRAAAVRLFTAERVYYSISGSSAAAERFDACIPVFEKALAEAVRKRSIPEDASDGEAVMRPAGRELSPVSTLNEGIKTSSPVNYVARCGDFATEGLAYRGALKVLRIMLNYDYLWIKLRVLGGAYGCMSAFSRNGRCYLVSYRDPEIGKTNTVFEELPAYLESWQGDEASVRKYIIGAISAMDRPLTSSDKAAQSVADCFYRMSDEELQADRGEVLECSAEDIRGCAAYIRALLKSGAVCTIGNETQIEKESGLFKSLRSLSVR